MGDYIMSGPFNSGAPPGLDSPFFNNVESWIQQVEGDIGSVPVNGTTAGTATMYQFLQGTVKAFFMFFNSYRNSTATEQQIALPVAFTTWALWWAGATPAVHIYNSGSQVNSAIFQVTSEPSAGGAGGISVQSQINGYSYGEIAHAFDHIGLGVSMGQTQTGGLFVIGI